MPRLEMPDARLFKAIVDALSDIVDEVAIQLGPEGLRLRALDVSQTALAELELPRDSFADYTFEEPTNVGVSLAYLSKLLKGVKKGERLILELEGDRVKLTLEAAIRTSFVLRNLDVPAPELTAQGLEFDVEAQLMSNAFRTAIEDISAVSDVIEFQASPGLLRIGGGAGSKAEAKFEEGSPALLLLNVKKESRSSYQASYLSIPADLSRHAEAATLKFSSDSPLMVELPMGGGKFAFIVAPSA
ncbi:MAG: DNA polymerase sliding clamp [Desulfurococcaceae archaeon]